MHLKHMVSCLNNVQHTYLAVIFISYILWVHKQSDHVAIQKKLSLNTFSPKNKNKKQQQKNPLKRNKNCIASLQRAKIYLEIAQNWL